MGPWYTSLVDPPSTTHEVHQVAVGLAAGGTWWCGGGTECQCWHAVSEMFGMTDVGEKWVG